MRNNFIKFGGFKKPKLRDLEFYIHEQFEGYKLIVNDFNSFIGLYKPLTLEFKTRPELISFIDHNEDIRISSMHWEYDQKENLILVMESVWWENILKD